MFSNLWSILTSSSVLKYTRQDAITANEQSLQPLTVTLTTHRDDDDVASVDLREEADDEESSDTEMVKEKLQEQKERKLKEKLIKGKEKQAKEKKKFESATDKRKAYEEKRRAHEKKQENYLLTKVASSSVSLQTVTTVSGSADDEAAMENHITLKLPVRNSKVSLIKKLCTPITAKRRMVWIDLEMTGLDIEKDHILEIACIVTEGNLDIVQQGPNLIIHQSQEILDSMSPWHIENYKRSGLTEAVQNSNLSLAEAEQQILRFVEYYTPKGTCPLAGNSVHYDKKFLDKYMKKLMEHFHYRIVDVSTIKELCKRWYPFVTKCRLKKKGRHRALDDIQESIEELRFYQKNIFKKFSEF